VKEDTPLSKVKEQNKSMVRRLYEAQTMGDLHAMRELLAPTSTIIDWLPAKENPAAKATYGAMPWIMVPSPISATSSRSSWRLRETGW
jgi:hypothetical protein